MLFQRAAIFLGLFLTIQLHTAPQPSLIPRDDFWITDGPVFALLEYENTLYVGGQFANVGPNTGTVAVLPNAGTSPDLTWPKLRAPVYAATSDGAGGWFIGGGMFDANEANPGAPDHRFLFVHLKADKTIDSNFNLSLDGHVFAMLRDGSTLYLGGGFTSVGSSNRNYLAAVDTTTGAVKSWNPNADSYVYAFAKHGSKIIAGGGFSQVGGQAHQGLTAIDSTSGAPQLFPALTGSGETYALLVSGNTLYVGGNFTSIGGQSRADLAAIELIGNTVTTGFDAGSVEPPAYQAVYALAMAQSKLYVGGLFDSIGEVPSSDLAVLDPSTGENLGTSFDTFHHDGCNVSALAVNGTTVFVGGRFTELGGEDRNYLASINSADDKVTVWDPHATGGFIPNQPVQALAHDGSNLLVGGELVSVGAVGRSHLAAFDVSTGQALPWNPAPSAPVYALAQHDAIIYVGGEFLEIGGVPRTALAGIDEFGNATDLDPAYILDPFDGVYQLVAANGTLFVGGKFRYGLGHINLAQYDLVENSLVDWTPDPLGPVYAMALDGNTLFLGGGFSLIRGETRNYVGAVDVTTGQPTPWNPNANSPVYSLAVEGNAVFAGGPFSNIGGESRANIAKLSKSTALAAAWILHGIANPYALSIAGNHLFIGGDFLNAGNRDLSLFAVADTQSAALLPIDLHLHPTMLNVIHAGERNFYIGGNQSGSLNKVRPNLSVHRLAPYLYPPIRQPNGSMLIPVDLPPDQSYLLETSDDLEAWNSLGAYSNVSSITDTTATGIPHRVYRLQEEPPR